jgi:hypothetical protein
MTTDASNDSGFYFPQFTDYADYDFRNEQSLMMLEDIF